MPRAISGRGILIACIIGVGGLNICASADNGRESRRVDGDWGAVSNDNSEASDSDEVGWASASDQDCWSAVPEKTSWVSERDTCDWTDTCDGPSAGVTCDGAAIGDACCPHPVCNRVYIIRGAVGWWPAIHTFLARLKRHGYAPDVYMFGGVNKAVDYLVERRRSGEEAGPVRIIGYSLGGHGAFNMASQLKERGIVVDRLLLVECFSNPTITSNVRYCFNIYETRQSDSWLIFRGTPVTRESCCTKLVNINVAVEPGWTDLKSRNHFTMADDKRVHQTLIHLLSCDCIWGGSPARGYYSDDEP